MLIAAAEKYIIRVMNSGAGIILNRLYFAYNLATNIDSVLVFLIASI